MGFFCFPGARAALLEFRSGGLISKQGSKDPSHRKETNKNKEDALKSVEVRARRSNGEKHKQNKHQQSAPKKGGANQQ
jgi:hypothetical protein